MTRARRVSSLTGRIASGPGALVHEEVLAPQFRYDVEHLLPHYVRVETVLLLEYERMGVLDPGQVAAVAAALAELTAQACTADPAENLSDLSFAVERFVLDRLPGQVPEWRVDRSRNDMQACAQLMWVREQTLLLADDLATCAAAAVRAASRHLADVMPGYTHLQPAQVVTAGFFFAGLSGHLLRGLDHLLRTYDGFDASPLGSGAMSGQELPWDRERMARLLGFARAEPHALTAVASRAWLLELAAECSTFGVVLGRFVTDLMTWASGAYRFLELPDELAAISSAMPQKKNYPILERIRGRTAHATSWYLDVAVTQRATPFSNTVEVSKESTAGSYAALSALRSALRLLAGVLDAAALHTDTMRAACQGEFLGAFSLANRLTLRAGVPWRTAQVVAGEYVTAMLADATSDPVALLGSLAQRHGHPLPDPGDVLQDVFDVRAELWRKQSAGSTHPTHVAELLAGQEAEFARLTGLWEARHTAVDSAASHVDGVLAAARDGRTDAS